MQGEDMKEPPITLEHHPASSAKSVAAFMWKIYQYDAGRRRATL
jgi:hypothetical protein